MSAGDLTARQVGDVPQNRELGEISPSADVLDSLAFRDAEEKSVWPARWTRFLDTSLGGIPPSLIGLEMAYE